MSLKDILAPALETLTAHCTRNRLVLIHPDSRYRTLVVAALTHSAPCPVYYHTLTMLDTGLSQFLDGLTGSFTQQQPGFGHHLKQARQDHAASMERLAAALADDLQEIAGADTLIVLDDYDRSDAVPEIQSLVEHLVDRLPARCHLVISSRTIPGLPWAALAARRQAAIIRDSQVLTGAFYTEGPDEAPSIQAYALGPGYVASKGEYVDSWEGHQPRLLLFLALDRQMVTRADICRALWPELPPDQAVNVFHVTKRRLHKALGFDVLEHEGGHYRINPAVKVYYDVLEFVGKLVEARGCSGDTAARLWQHAIELYRGQYLQGHDDSWIVSRRADFHEGYIEALSSLGRIREAAGQYESALGLFLRAAQEAYSREDLHRDAIRLYGRLGRRSEAAEHYRRLKADLKARLGIKPSPETQKVYRTVTKD